MEKNAPDLRKLTLQESLIYGPVSSRRLGKSLGINPIKPGRKVCTFNCVYCQYVAVKPAGSLHGLSPDLFPGVEEVRAGLRERLLDLAHKGERIEYLTFAGNGEPTLHPDFPGLVRMVIELRDAMLPAAVRTAVLTNGTTLVDARVREAVRQLDTAIVKLDAATEKKIRQVNRPYRGFEMDRFLKSLTKLDNLVIQSLFFDGTLTNAGSDDVGKWIETLKHIQPREVQIYSLDRVPAEASVMPLHRDVLAAIAGRLFEETGIRALVY